MNITINNKVYEVVITYKNNKNMYLRVKKDLKIYITCPKYIKEKEIINFINSNLQSIYNYLMIYETKKKEQENKFLYLGKSYDICYTKTKNLVFGKDKVFLNRNYNLDKWYKNEALKVYLERLNIIYSLFEENIPYPKLRIRKMTSKWGVCNVKDKIITLNLELIKLDIKYLDYVIVHELAHFIYQNHSKSFYKVVEKYVPNYKKYRQEMKNII